MAIKQPITVPPGVRRLCSAVRGAGGRALVVGGTVRDAVLGRASADVDLEVHGLPVDALRGVLSAQAPVSEVGRSFGVFKLRVDGAEIDVALPRADSAAGEGVAGDPHIGVEAAARRRDLTINAMAWDPLEHALVDPLGGAADAAAGRLRAADPARFGEDPLRVWRVARFAGVLGFQPDPALVSLCRGIDLSGLAAERVRRELEKLLLGSPRPSVGWAVAVAVGAAAAWVPEAREGAGAALDRAAVRRDLAGRAPRPLALMLTTLLADGAGGADGACAALDRLGIVRQGRFPLRDQVRVGVEVAGALSRPLADGALRRLADRAEVGLCCLASAALHPAGAADANALQAAMLGVADAPLPALLRGRDLVSLGVPAGPALGPLLAAVREAQLDGEVSDRDGAMRLAGRLWSERPDGPRGA
jgi:tRNA nucleotidyltransferase (CCA-adding enzyme)